MDWALVYTMMSRSASTLTVVFEDVDSQSVGFYVRQNGGYLEETVPAGHGRKRRLTLRKSI